MREANGVELKELVQKLIPEVIGKEIEKCTQSIYPLYNVFIRKVRAVCVRCVCVSLEASCVCMCVLAFPLKKKHILSCSCFEMERVFYSSLVVVVYVALSMCLFSPCKYGE